MGFADAAAQIQDLYLDRRHRDAAAAVPFEFIDSTALLGPAERIGQRMRRYEQAGVTTLSVSLYDNDLDSALTTLRRTAEAFEKAGLAG
jgi:hypothetical protein